MVTRTRSGPLVPIALGAALLSLSACGKDDLARTFTGGSTSKDKQPIATTVSPTAGAPSAEEPALAEPVAAEKEVVAVTAEKLEEGKPIRETQMKYKSTRARDPFRSLIQASDNRSDLVDLSVVTLVAIVLGDDPFCVVEDAEGFSYVLRKGDRVKNGRLVAIKSDEVVASQTLLGFTSTVQLKLEERKGSHG